MILSKKELLFYISADRIIANKSAKINCRERLKNFTSPNYILMFLRSMRYVAYYDNVKRNSKVVGFKCYFHRWRYKRLGVKLGFTIGYNTFGYGLLIPHYGTIVINSSIKAGNFCVLHTSTCIGGGGKLIGDGLYLSSGALIMGSDIILGDNISVASNSLVNKSISTSNVLLAGTPAIIKSSAKAWYERDGKRYVKRIANIEKLRLKMEI